MASGGRALELRLRRTVLFLLHCLGGLGSALTVALEDLLPGSIGGGEEEGLEISPGGGVEPKVRHAEHSAGRRGAVVHCGGAPDHLRDAGDSLHLERARGGPGGDEEDLCLAGLARAHLQRPVSLHADLAAPVLRIDEEKAGARALLLLLLFERLQEIALSLADSALHRLECGAGRQLLQLRQTPAVCVCHEREVGAHQRNCRPLLLLCLSLSAPPHGRRHVHLCAAHRDQHALHGRPVRQLLRPRRGRVHEPAPPRRQPLSVPVDGHAGEMALHEVSARALAARPPGGGLDAHVRGGQQLPRRRRAL
mmetsp:Transcript_9107/g.37561  ORF Transcript_9107/g.37561 Transcript_9107/m.37561 type:complete len:308 (-) Transcript_9107:102-1025(-)